MSFKLIVLALCLASSHAAKMWCDFGYTKSKDFYCKASITTTRTDYFIDEIDGNFNDFEDRTRNDVALVEFIGNSMEVLPKNLFIVFRNLRSISIVNVENYPNFHRSDFYDFRGIQSFSFSRLPQVGLIPKDAFMDINFVSELYFSDMPNLEDFDPELLTGNFLLKTFSVDGAPKITTIPAGFFRFQEELETVRFTNTGLTTISYDVFIPTRNLKFAFFTNAGCLNRNYDVTNMRLFNFDIRNKCKNYFGSGNSNAIMKQKNKDFSSSSSSESQNKQ